MSANLESLLIHEIYASLQGESTFAGIPCTFVRTAACNLRCRWCDTPQAFTGGTRMKREDVLERALSLDTPLVELTGGEPLLQPAVPLLMRELCDAGKTVLIETSGERDISVCDRRVHRIMDLKAPGSGECARNRLENIALLGERDEVKFVLADRADYEWARTMVRDHALASRAGAVLFSCVFGELEPRALAAWILEDKLPVRMQLQAHKYIWGGDAQGV
ncbi:MAG: radical SAM protein [Polyangiaceae bacterium]|nr:radical SAM protein [Polyangiaceae bacterium]